MIISKELIEKLKDYGINYNGSNFELPFNCKYISDIDWEDAISRCEETYLNIINTGSDFNIIRMKGMYSPLRIQMNMGKINGVDIPVKDIHDAFLKCALMYAYIKGQDNDSVIKILHDLIDI